VTVFFVRWAQIDLLTYLLIMNKLYHVIMTTNTDRTHTAAITYTMIK